MATTVTDPYTILADAIEVVVRNEFDDESFLTFRHDRLHESLGSDGNLYVGVSPEVERTQGIDMFQQVLIQFYGGFHPDVDPYQEIDPRIIANKAERLRRALARARVVATSEVWFFDVLDTNYPSDATGNKTRFEMRIQGRGQNSALVET